MVRWSPRFSVLQLVETWGCWRVPRERRLPPAVDGEIQAPAGAAPGPLLTLLSVGPWMSSPPC